MVGLVLLLVVVAVVVGVLILMSMRGTVAELEDAETHLHDPETPTVIYRVPEGVDPAAVRGVLHANGFDSVVDVSPMGTELVRVECTTDQREQVRELIAHVPVGEGPDVQESYGEVVFADER